jgi:oxalate decarboxylase/phosphoglucose isomerase-like protein (cupin superfamily)
MRHAALLVVVGLGCFSLGTLTAQTQAPAQPAVVVGDLTTPLKALAGDGNVAISNAVLRDQPEVRVLHVRVEPGGSRAMHAHTDVKFHLFIPISGSMEMTVDDAHAVAVPAWQPFYMKASTRHAFHNSGTAPVDILELFVR